MDENNKINELVNEDGEELETLEEKSNDVLKEKVDEVVEKLRTQAMLLGAKTMATVIYNMLQGFHNAPGKRTLNDYRRIVKQVEKFCKTSVDREVEMPTFGKDDDNA